MIHVYVQLSIAALILIAFCYTAEKSRAMACFAGWLIITSTLSFFQNYMYSIGGSLYWWLPVEPGTKTAFVLILYAFLLTPCAHYSKSIQFFAAVAMIMFYTVTSIEFMVKRADSYLYYYYYEMYYPLIGVLVGTFIESSVIDKLRQSYFRMYNFVRGFVRGKRSGAAI